MCNISTQTCDAHQVKPPCFLIPNQDKHTRGTTRGAVTKRWYLFLKASALSRSLGGNPISKIHYFVSDTTRTEYNIRSNSRSEGKGKTLRLENRREGRVVFERRILDNKLFGIHLLTSARFLSFGH